MENPDMFQGRQDRRYASPDTRFVPIERVTDAWDEEAQRRDEERRRREAAIRKRQAQIEVDAFLIMVRGGRTDFSNQT